VGKGLYRGVTAAAANLKQMPADYRVSITNAPGATSYPISSFTYLLIPVHAADPAKGKVIKDLLSWIVKYGEGEVTALSYAPLPRSWRKRNSRASTRCSRDRRAGPAFAPDLLLFRNQPPVVDRRAKLCYHP